MQMLALDVGTLFLTLGSLVCDFGSAGLELGFLMFSFAFPD